MNTIPGDKNILPAGHCLSGDIGHCLLTVYRPRRTPLFYCSIDLSPSLASGTVTALNCGGQDFVEFNVS